jgi:predicted acetyltransferase
MMLNPTQKYRHIKRYLHSMLKKTNMEIAFFRKNKKKITGIIKASHVVTHRNTGLTRCCLTSLSGTGSGMVSII